MPCAIARTPAIARTLRTGMKGLFMGRCAPNVISLFSVSSVSSVSSEVETEEAEEDPTFGRGASLIVYSESQVDRQLCNYETIYFSYTQKKGKIL